MNWLLFSTVRHIILLSIKYFLRHKRLLSQKIYVTLSLTVIVYNHKALFFPVYRRFYNIYFLLMLKIINEPLCFLWFCMTSFQAFWLSLNRGSTSRLYLIKRVFYYLERHVICFIRKQYNEKGLTILHYPKQYAIVILRFGVNCTRDQIELPRLV